MLLKTTTWMIDSEIFQIERVEFSPLVFFNELLNLSKKHFFVRPIEGRKRYTGSSSPYSMPIDHW